jgi:hypothetical protein
VTMQEKRRKNAVVLSEALERGQPTRLVERRCEIFV